MPTSASDIRHADVVPVTLRRRARAHTASAANGSTATVMSATPLNVPTQPCNPLTMPPPLPSDREIYPGPGRAPVVMVRRVPGAGAAEQAAAAAPARRGTRTLTHRR